MNNTVSKSAKMIMAGMAIAALSASVYARGGDDCEFEGRGPGGMNTERMEKFREQHLAKLHDKVEAVPAAGNGVEKIRRPEADAGREEPSRPG